MAKAARGVGLLAVALGVTACTPEGPTRDEVNAVWAQLEVLETQQQAQASALMAAQSEVNRLEAEKARAAEVYTRGELDALLSVPQPWTISIPVESARASGAAFWYGNPLNVRGLRMQEGGSAVLDVGFTLPDAYRSGTDLELRLTWAKHPLFSSICNFHVKNEAVVANRPGVEPLRGGASFRGAGAGAREVSLPAPAGRSVQQLVIDLEGGEYQPGDQLSFSFSRNGADAQDTCTGTSADFIVLGMSAHPRQE